MRISRVLGLDDERFCKVIVRTKMFGMVNVLGHVAELHYEKYLQENGISYNKAPTDVHYDYEVGKRRHQVKRWETASTDKEFLGVNLTKTHGNRNGPDAFYTTNDFDDLIVYDVGFSNFAKVETITMPTNKKYVDRLPGRYKIKRENQLTDFQREFLIALNAKNEKFIDEIEKLRTKYTLTYVQFLEKISGLTLDEIDSLFSVENFRLVVGAKGFVAEEHFNILLTENNIHYEQVTDMYSKVDHNVNGKRIQVKTIHERSTDNENYGFKTHKTHGHGESELYKDDEFDLVALFVGFDYNGSIDKYIPTSAKTEFVFIPISDIEKHPKYPGHLKRVSKASRQKYRINDLSIFK